MKFINVSLVFFNILICNSQIVKDSITLRVDPIIDINNCLKWHVDFSELKTTVLYGNHLISMGIDGGMIAVNTNNKTIDEGLSSILNSDLFTNLAVRNDTIFAERFGEILFFEKEISIWKNYSLNIPVSLFNILYEDSKYSFFPVNHGEFGSLLFIYDKNLKALRAVSLDYEVQAIFLEKDEYYLMSSGQIVTSILKFKNINKVRIVSKGKEHLSYFRKLPIYENPKLRRKPSKQSKVLTSVFRKDSGLILQGSFKIGRERYYTLEDNSIIDIDSIDDMPEISTEYYTYISKIEKGVNRIIDSIQPFKVVESKLYGNLAVLNSSFYDKGFYYVTDNSLTFINYSGTPDYSFTYENINPLLTNTQEQINLIQSKFTYNNNYYIREFAYDFNEFINVRFLREMDNDSDIYIHNKSETKKLRLNNDWNVLEFGFKYSGNHFLFFKNLGNIDHKYGLIEIYDLNRFLDIYTFK